MDVSNLQLSGYSLSQFILVHNQEMVISMLSETYVVVHVCMCVLVIECGQMRPVSKIRLII